MNWAYLLRCADGTYYAGWTNDLEKRLKAHNTGHGAKYTHGRGPVQLAWAQKYPTKSEAMVQEAKLKKLSKQEKMQLAAGFTGVPDLEETKDFAEDKEAEVEK